MGVGVAVGMGVGVAKMFGATVGVIEVGHGLLPTVVALLCNGWLLLEGDVAVLPVGIEDVLPAVAGTLIVVELHGKPPGPLVGDGAPAAPVGWIEVPGTGILFGTDWLGVVVVVWLGVVVVV